MTCFEAAGGGLVGLWSSCTAACNAPHCTTIWVVVFCEVLEQVSCVAVLKVLTHQGGDANRRCENANDLPAKHFYTQQALCEYANKIGSAVVVRRTFLRADGGKTMESSTSSGDDVVMDG